MASSVGLLVQRARVGRTWRPHHRVAAIINIVLLYRYAPYDRCSRKFSVLDAAVLADCIPVIPGTTAPLQPARDYMVMSYSGVLPSLILPAILGVIFNAFRSRSYGAQSGGNPPCIAFHASKSQSLSLLARLSLL
eukprot:SAG11_NODE_2538_length_3243_cov_1.535623_3_plen_135_part_00